MAKQTSIESAERQARELLDGRIASVRALVHVRQRLSELRETLASVEREDVSLYNAALGDGWSVDELRKIGLGEPEKKARVRRRRTTTKLDNTTPATKSAEKHGDDPVPANYVPAPGH